MRSLETSGGLQPQVDRNRHKGCTIAKAREQGIRSAHLPLADYIDMGNYSRVLTVPTGK